MTVKEKIKNLYDKYAAGYDAGTKLQRYLATILARALEKDAVGFVTLLDVGCGTGYVAQEVDARHFYAGCDISLSMLRCARNKTTANYIQADAASLPFFDSSFDMVVSNAAYQWVFDLKAAFKEVKRVLKPKGRFYFTVFNKNTLWQLQEIFRLTGPVRPASSHFPDKNILEAALSEKGFNIIGIETFKYEKYYKDLWELLGMLKNIGSTVSQNRCVCGLGWRSILTQANDLYAEKFADKKGLVATYEAFLIKAQSRQERRTGFYD